MINSFDELIGHYSEDERLTKLYSYNIVNDYDKAGAFKHIVGMAANLFKVPVAIVSFVDRERVLIRSSVGIDNLTEVDRELTICSRAIQQNQVTVFSNAKEDPCLLSNPFVHGEFGLQFYAGAPLRTPDGLNIGMLAIIDTKPRVFTPQDEQLLQELAAMVMEELEDRLPVSNH
jgi:GAF domain-containing protein